VRGAEWAWGGKQQISKGAQGLSLVEPFANMCLAFLCWTAFVYDLSYKNYLDIYISTPLLKTVTFITCMSNVIFKCFSYW